MKMFLVLSFRRSNKSIFKTLEIQQNMASQQQVSPEVQQAKQKYEMVHGKLQNVMSALHSNADSMRRSELTLQELSRLPEDTKAYKSIGRMFLRSPMQEIKEDLQFAYSQTQERSKVLETQKVRLQEEFKQTIDNFKEVSKR